MLITLSPKGAGQRTANAWLQAPFESSSRAVVANREQKVDSHIRSGTISYRKQVEMSEIKKSERRLPLSHGQSLRLCRKENFLSVEAQLWSLLSRCRSSSNRCTKRPRLFAVVEDDSHGVPVAGTHTAHAMTQIHSVSALDALYGAMTDRECHSITLLKAYHLGP